METSLPALLTTLQSSLESAVLPSSLDVSPPTNSISLLDLKNELFLSYLQNLVFLILIKLRHTTNPKRDPDARAINDEVTKKLAELRLYIEKGVKPLEGKLKYQIDKVVKAAEDASRLEAGKSNGDGMKKQEKNNNNRKKHKRRADESEDSERSSASSSESDEDASAFESDIDELSYRPNPAALMRPATTQQTADHKPKEEGGYYRPPRITATAMPTPLTTRGKEEKAERKPNKSATLDEFITEEMSTAPRAEPSIGSTIVSGGRRLKTQKERDEDAERTRYEETHLTRLPALSKKEKGKRNKSAGWGGEDFRDLDAGLDRIGGLVKRKEGGGKKRSYDAVGGGGGVGDVGGAFEKRRKSVMRRMR